MFPCESAASLCFGDLVRRVRRLLGSGFLLQQKPPSLVLCVTAQPGQAP